MLFYYSPIFLEHATGEHPERPERLATVARHLDREGLTAGYARPDWRPASPQRVALVHSLAHLEHLRAVCTAGGGHLDADTPCGKHSLEAALLAAGAVVDAVERVIRGDDHRAFCLLRPPGHHALPDAAMGFCLVNHAAIAARVATQELGLDRILIIDWDVHHGNGTQATFWEDPTVGYLSIHRWPFYPGTGDADETGAGPGLGATVNAPVRFGVPRAIYRDQFRAALEGFAAVLRPQLILLSAGFDAHREDPVGSLGLEVEDFATLTDAVIDVANVHANGRVVSLLEGGYNPAVLAESVEAHLRRLA